MTNKKSIRLGGGEVGRPLGTPISAFVLAKVDQFANWVILFYINPIFLYYYFPGWQQPSECGLVEVLAKIPHTPFHIHLKNKKK